MCTTFPVCPTLGLSTLCKAAPALLPSFSCYGNSTSTEQVLWAINRHGICFYSCVFASISPVHRLHMLDLCRLTKTLSFTSYIRFLQLSVLWAGLFSVFKLVSTAGDYGGLVLNAAASAAILGVSLFMQVMSFL
jgi:hypothetical protein